MLKDVFTTGQVAIICCVASRTVNKWIDNGLLIGYRLPGSLDRRVSIESLEKFAAQHEIEPAIYQLKLVRAGGTPAKVYLLNASKK